MRIFKIKKLSKKVEWVGNFKSNNCEKTRVKKESLSSAIKTTQTASQTYMYKAGHQVL